MIRNYHRILCILFLLSSCNFNNHNYEYYSKLKAYQFLSNIYSDEVLHQISNLCKNHDEGKDITLEYASLEKELMRSSITTGDALNKARMLSFTYNLCIR